MTRTEEPSAEQALLAMMPFAGACGIELDRADADETVGKLAWSPQRCTAGDVLHGGALMTLADSIGAVCAYLGLPQGATTSTITSSTNFFRAVTGGEVTATARPLHRGRTAVVIQTELTDDAGTLVAQVTQTQGVLTAGSTSS